MAAMAVQVLVENLSIPLVYGAQENELNEKFWKFIDKEVVIALKKEKKNDKD